MKIFKMKVIFLGLFFCIVTTMISARVHEPSNSLAAYNNEIFDISYSMGSDNQHAIMFQCESDPICMYTPLTYEDSCQDSLTKTYFLPRTKCVDSHMRSFYKDLHGSLKSIGIDLQINEIKDTNYGLQMSFTMQSDDAYQIIKIVDNNKKTVRFDIVAKI